MIEIQLCCVKLSKKKILLIKDMNCVLFNSSFYFIPKKKKKKKISVKIFELFILYAIYINLNSENISFKIQLAEFDSRLYKSYFKSFKNHTALVQ